jgi:hypothetical protein
MDLGAGLEEYEKTHTKVIRILAQLACSQSLYRLRHPGRHFRRNTLKNRCLQCCVVYYVYVIG